MGYLAAATGVVGLPLGEESGGDVAREGFSLVSRAWETNTRLSMEEDLMSDQTTAEPVTENRLPTVALACGALGIVGAVFLYWLIMPGLVLGLAGFVLGRRARRGGVSEGGSVALALGIVALLLVPSVILIVDAADDYARDCALNPTKPDC